MGCFRYMTVYSLHNCDNKDDYDDDDYDDNNNNNNNNSNINYMFELCSQTTPHKIPVLQLLQTVRCNYSIYKPVGCDKLQDTRASVCDSLYANTCVF